MPWLKRNLFLVVGGVIALGLLGIAGYFLYTKIQQNTAVTTQLNETTERLKALVNRDPHPGTEQVNNIAAAKEEQAKLKVFLGQVKTHFSPPPPTNQMTSREFRSYLDNTISDLRRQAERAGVQVETNYWFTFGAHKSSVNFPTNHVGTLALQLADIKGICRILYDAKIVALTGLKRIAVTSDDVGTSDYTTLKGETNNWAIITPYEVTFDTFSSELAMVLKGLLRSKDCFVVKNVTVEKTADAQTQQDETMSQGEGTFDPQRSMMDRYGLASRYGLGGRYGMGMRPPMMQPVPQMTAPRPAARGGLEVVLEEKTLRVTLAIDSVRLKAR